MWSLPGACPFLELPTLNTKESHAPLRSTNSHLKGLVQAGLKSIEGFFEVDCLFFLKHICYSSCLCVKMQIFWLATGKRSAIKNKYANIIYFSSDVSSLSIHSFIHSFIHSLLTGCLLHARNCSGCLGNSSGQNNVLAIPKLLFQRKEAISKRIINFSCVGCW